MKIPLGIFFNLYILYIIGKFSFETLSGYNIIKSIEDALTPSLNLYTFWLFFNI